MPADLCDGLPAEAARAMRLEWTWRHRFHPHQLAINPRKTRVGKHENPSI